MNKVTTNIIILFLILLCSSCTNEHRIFGECGIVVSKYNVIDEFYVVMLTLPYCESKRIEVSKHCYEDIKVGEFKSLSKKEKPEMLNFYER